ncbi:MAG: hypothetical protein QM811_10650 [Pirellulales bacterium]
MEAAFGKASLKNYSVEGNRIRVPRGEEAAYMAALADAQVMPAQFGSHIDKIMNSTDLWSSKEKQKERLKHGMQMELSQVIRKMPGIDSALVMYDMKEEGGLSRKKVYSASVAVKTIGSQALEENRVQAIRHLVAAAFAGMAPETVAVTDLTNNRSFPAGRPGEVLNGTQDPAYQTKLAYENEWTRKIQNALAYVPGTLVSVNVQLNPELENSERKISYESKTVVVDQQESSETSSATIPGNSGRPGLSAQGGISNQAASLGASTVAQSGRTEKESTKTNNRFATPGSETMTRRAGLTPKVVSVSIGVPNGYFEKVWSEENPANTKKPTASELKVIVDAESKRIQGYVAKLLPPRNINNPDLVPDMDVRVTNFGQPAVAETPGPDFASTAMAWLSAHASEIGAGVLGLIALMMLRSLVKNIPSRVESSNEDDDATPTITSAAQAGGAVVGEATGDPNSPAPKKLSRRNKSGSNLRDELVEIVREDPDTAANILRSWINASN